LVNSMEYGYREEREKVVLASKIHIHRVLGTEDRLDLLASTVRTL